MAGWASHCPGSHVPHAGPAGRSPWTTRGRRRRSRRAVRDAGDTVNRPDTPTFWRLSDLVRSLDAKAILSSEDAMSAALTEVNADPESVSYLATQRSARMMPHVHPDFEQLVLQNPELATRLLAAVTVAWMEGFVCGRRFEEPE